MIKYRKARMGDAEKIGYVLKECYNIKSKEEGIRAFKEETAKGYNYIVAVNNADIIGLTSWQMHGLPKHGLCELDRIAVLGKFRGRGVAKKLFEALVKAAKSRYNKFGYRLRKLYILTHADNKRAQEFYEKMACKHETTLRRHYYKDVDEFVFSRFF